jgi:hypothetical protein
MRRRRTVSIYFMHQYLNEKHRQLIHRKGTELAADCFTKGLSYEVLVKHLRDLGYEDA